MADESQIEIHTGKLTEAGSTWPKLCRRWPNARLSARLNVLAVTLATSSTGAKLAVTDKPYALDTRVAAAPKPTVSFSFTPKPSIPARSRS